MYKYIACIIFVITLILLGPSNCIAQEWSESGVLKSRKIENVYDYRVANLKNFLEKYNSPLAPYSQEIIRIADIYNIDYRLVPAITGVESTFGKRIPSQSYNAYGWANGNYSFESWEDSIDTVTSTLRTKYIDRGANTIDKIGKIYAPPSKTWAIKVKYFVTKIDPMPVSFEI